MCSGPHPFIPATGVLKLILEYSSDGDIAQNDLYIHHKDGSVWSAAQITAMHSTVHGAWVSHLQAYMSDQYTLTAFHSVDLSSSSGTYGDDTYSNPGLDTATAMPRGISFAIKFTTGQRGRSYRGRVFAVGLTDHRLHEDEIDHGYASDLITGWGAVGTAINGVTNCEHAVISQCHAGAWRAAAVVTPVLGYSSTDFYLDYQRRRALAHSRHH